MKTQLIPYKRNFGSMDDPNCMSTSFGTQCPCSEEYRGEMEREFPRKRSLTDYDQDPEWGKERET